MQSVRFESLSSNDASKIALQRTSTLLRLPVIGAVSERFWIAGIGWPLRFEAFMRRKRILQGALKEIESEYGELRRALEDRNIGNLVDIGCGHAFVDLYFARDYGCRVHLVDIEQNERHHFDFAEEAAAYASLRQAKAFLVDNGVPPHTISTTNPSLSALDMGTADLVLSLYSCGFHYPLRTYFDQVWSALGPGGAFIFDLRKGGRQDFDWMSKGEARVIRDRPKSQRIMLTKPKQQSIEQHATFSSQVR